MPMSSIIRTLALATFMLVSFSTASAQSKSSPSAAEAQRHLMQLTVPDDMDTNVPSLIRDAIVELKIALATQTDAVVSQLSAATTADAAKQRLGQALPPPTIGKIPDDEWRKRNESDSKAPIAGLYGGELTVSVKQPKPSLLLVQESFDIACGNDNVLLVYSNAGGAWKRILLWQSKPYTSVGEAFGDTYETLLLHPEHNGHPLLLVLHGTPWCTSTVSGFGMDVFELRASSTTVPLWHGEHGYRRADLDPPLTLRATDNGFEVRTSVNVWGDGDRVARKGVMRYTATHNRIHRVEPIATNGRDSVEEWLAMPQQEAAEFADEPAGSLTWTMFQNFTYRGKAEDANNPLTSVKEVYACKDDPMHYEAHVTSEVYKPTIKKWSQGPAYFVQLRQVTNGYRIHAVTRLRDPACNGHDLMSPP